MSDNIPLPNSNEVAAADDIAGVKYQRIKVIHGNDGVNDGDVSRTNPLPVEDIGITFLRRIFQLLKPLGVVTGNGSNRLSIDVNTAGTVSTVTTVSTVSNVNNQTNMGGVSAFEMMKALSRNAYTNGIRSRL